MSISIAIPTLGREKVLLDTINELLQLPIRADEILIVDQTVTHQNQTQTHLQRWHQEEKIRWIRIQYKSITHAMNIALRKAKSESVLFLDDDIIPDESLVEEHLRCSYDKPSFIIAGRVLQPWHHGKADALEKPFLFNSLEERVVTSFMGGNVLIPRREAIRIGGFDTNFVRVAYHFEAEFAHRWINSGNQIYYAPKALIHHLKTGGGGTRSYGNHLTTIKPDHAVGRHYFYLCTYSFRDAIRRSMRDIFKSSLTKHHLKYPLWIPFTFVSEITGYLWAILLIGSGRGLIASEQVSLLITSSHPIQYYSPIFCRLDKSQDFRTVVFYLSLPNARSQSLGFGQDFNWDIPLLKGYNYRVARTFNGRGLFAGFFGVTLKRPWQELKQIKRIEKPDLILMTGWHFWGMVQFFLVSKFSNIPIVLRMDSNSLHKRNRLLMYIYHCFFSWVDICLSVGNHNLEFCLDSGVPKDRVIRSPHVVDNDFFYKRSCQAKQNYEKLRDLWEIPGDAFCFIYAGKLQSKKRPLDLLTAFKQACRLDSTNKIHLLMVGTGPLRSQCKHYSLENNLPVSFVGFLNQSVMPEAYAIADCIVLPSDEGETWGLVINEAMACGLPAIVSDKVGCAPDLVLNGTTGFQFACGNIEELTELLVYMSNNTRLAQEMGSTAQRLVHKEYSLEKVVKSIEQAVLRIHG
ncbi:MAG: glycosyltransferase [Cyanobacteriota bacterium]